MDNLQTGRSGALGGEFHDQIYQNLPFDRCPWLVSDVELTELYGPFHQSSEVSGLCNICFIGCSVGISMV